MDAYGEFSYVYDELMDATPYEEWCSRIDGLIQKYGVSRPVRLETSDMIQSEQDGGGNGEACDNRLSREELLSSERNLVLDLGCGTGTLTQLLYDKGYDMIGVDCSEEMLSCAMEKREETGSSILYLCQDMRELELYSTVGTVISVCDSLNYILEEEELLAVFRLVNNYLYPGGIFVFDFNTVYKYAQVIGDATIAENREDCSFIWENYYDEESRINEYDLTVFVKRQEDTEQENASEEPLFHRFSETHFQKGYTAEEICELLERAGMKILEMKDADTEGEVTEASERIYVVAREWGKEENV